MSSKFDKQTVIVTGGAGFIGSHLCDALVQRYQVICIDNFITSRQLNIDHLLRNPDFVFLRHDLTEPLQLDKLPELERFRIRTKGIQYVYHAACPTSPKQYKEIPIETMLANSHATRNALDMAVKYQARFLLTSSGVIYGDPLDAETPLSEDYWGFVDPVGERSAYVEGKRFAESMTVAYQRCHHIDTKIARVFHTYGPRMLLGDGRLVPDFVKAALDGKPLEVFERKDAFATFCYISDIVDALIKLMESNEQGPINLGSTDKVVLADVAQKVIDLTESSSQIEFREAIPYVGFNGIPDIRLVKDRLGWFPVTKLEHGLQQTIDDLRAGQVRTIESLQS